MEKKPVVLILRSSNRHFPLDLAPELEKANYEVTCLAGLEDYIGSPARNHPFLAVMEIGGTVDLDRALVVFEWAEMMQPLAPARFLLLLAHKNISLAGCTQLFGSAEFAVLPQPTRNLLFKMALQHRLLSSPQPEKKPKSEGFTARVEERGIERQRILVMRGQTESQGKWNDEGQSLSGKIRWRWVRRPTAEKTPADAYSWIADSLKEPQFDPDSNGWLMEGEDDDLVCEHQGKELYSARKTMEAEARTKAEAFVGPGSSFRNLPPVGEPSEARGAPAKPTSDDSQPSSVPDESQIRDQKEKTARPLSASKQGAPQSAPSAEKKSEKSQKPGEITEDPVKPASTVKSADGAIHLQRTALRESKGPVAWNMHDGKPAAPKAAPAPRPAADPTEEEKRTRTASRPAITARGEPSEKKTSAPPSSADPAAFKPAPKTFSEETAPQFQSFQSLQSAEEIENSPEPETPPASAEPDFPPDDRNFAQSIPESGDAPAQPQATGNPAGTAKKEAAPMPSLGEAVPEVGAYPQQIADYSSKHEWHDNRSSQSSGAIKNAAGTSEASPSPDQASTGEGPISPPAPDTPEEKKTSASLALPESDTKQTVQQQTATPISEPAATNKPKERDPLQVGEGANRETDRPEKTANAENQRQQKNSLKAILPYMDQARARSQAPALEESEGRSFLKQRHSQLMTLIELKDQESSWHPAGKHRIYLSAQHRYFGLKNPADALPLWVYEGELAPEFIEEKQAWKFYDRLPVAISTLDTLPADVLDHINRLCGIDPDMPQKTTEPAPTKTGPAAGGELKIPKGKNRDHYEPEKPKARGWRSVVEFLRAIFGIGS